MTNNTKNSNQQNLNIIATDPLEENLSWLQEFHATKIKPLAKGIPDDIADDQLKKLLHHNTKNYHPGFFIIYNTRDPGWIINFFDCDNSFRSNALHDSWKEINMNLITNRLHSFGYYNEENIYALKKGEVYDSFGSALYLNVIIYIFKHYIDKKDFEIFDLVNLKYKIKSRNILLTWLEELYFGACDEEWESFGGG